MKTILATAAAATSGGTTEQSLLAVLASDAERQKKAHACQDLAVYGGEASIPILAALLSDEVLSDYARSGLEIIDHPAAGAALREALTQLEGRLLAGVINSLGVRRDTTAVPALIPFVDPENEVAGNALTALAMIGTEASVQPLQRTLADPHNPLFVPAAHAALLAADQLLASGQPQPAKALRGAVAKAGSLPDHLKAAARASL